MVKKYFDPRRFGEEKFEFKIIWVKKMFVSHFSVQTNFGSKGKWRHPSDTLKTPTVWTPS